MLSYFILCIGLAFIWLEFYLPGSVFAIMGSLSIFIALYIKATESRSFIEFLVFFILAAFGVIVVIRLALHQIKQSGKNNSFLLEKDQSGYEASSYEENLIGKEGISASDLSPAGYVFINEKRYPAVSQGTYIDKGTPIIVLSGEGSRLIVKARKKEHSYERTD